MRSTTCSSDGVAIDRPRAGARIGTRIRALVISALSLFPMMLVASPAHAEQAAKVEWDDTAWRRVKWPEALVSVGLGASIFAIDALPYPDHATWSGPILFDKDARSFLKGDEQGKHTASTASDFMFYGMAAWPFIVDNYVVALGVHQNVDVAAQLTLMDMQAFGLSGVFTLSAEHLVGRARPPSSSCGQGLPDSPDAAACSRGDSFRSFYAGHPAAAFTSAGLTCAHHQNLPLYGGGVPDALACVGMVGVATTTGVLRIVADRHWASDVLVGSAVGASVGYFLPSLLHYRLFQAKRVDTSMKTSFGYVAPMPVVLEKGGGLGVVGVF